MRREKELRALYAAFNLRDLDAALARMALDVDWPNGWEGGRIVGRDNVGNYWERQWSAIDPTVDPIDVLERSDGRFEVTVHQMIRDSAGTLLADTQVRHVYTFRGNHITRMEIEE